MIFTIIDFKFYKYRLRGKKKKRKIALVHIYILFFENFLGRNAGMVREVKPTLLHSVVQLVCIEFVQGTYTKLEREVKRRGRYDWFRKSAFVPLARMLSQ